MSEIKSRKQLIDSLTKPIPNLNLDLLPTVVKNYASELSSTIGSDPIVSVFAMLAATSGAADARIRLELMNGFRVPPVLWMMTIGNPGSKKSPASEPVFEILHTLESESITEYKSSLIEWEAKEALFNNQKKDYIEAMSTEITGDTTIVTPNELPAKPVQLRFTVGDITSQKLIRHCSIRPEGALCYLDEMNGWVDKITNNKSGEDRSSWVQAYSSSRYSLDRVGDGETFCSNFAVSIYGNIQPKVLRLEISNLSRDGVLQRFIPAVLRSSFNGVGTPIRAEDSKIKHWERVIRTIHSSSLREYTLSKEAYVKFRRFQFWAQDFKNNLELEDPTSSFLTAVSKIEGVTGRLILIFNLIEQPYNSVVSEEIVIKVVELVKTFIIPSYKYTYGEAGEDKAKDMDLWIIEYILKVSKDKDTLTLRGLKRSTSAIMRRLEISNKDTKTNFILESMQKLEEQKWVSLVEDSNAITSWKINSKVKSLA